jgi:gamma-glutamylcyclotransferase (GGCT)/AIG2-like uncharacterized protein YtfP
MKRQYYFAYGSNLNQGDLLRSNRNRESPQLKPRTAAWLPDHELAFTYRSQKRQGGVLDVLPRRGHVVPGMLFEVDEAGWASLDRKEGSPTCYERVECTVIGPAGEFIPAVTYRVIAEKRQPFVKPTDDYIRIVCEGLASHDLPDDHVLAAAAGTPSTPWLDSFFFYGTLMRGESRFPLLVPFGFSCILLAEAAGRLLDRGTFPALVATDSADTMVAGEFVRINDFAAAIETLDAIEGFQGYGSASSLFRRTLIHCDVGDGRIRPSWTYVYAGEEQGKCIPSGDWRVHRNRRESFLASLVREHVGEDEQRIAAEIAARIPFSFDDDRPAVIRSLLPLCNAVARGEISERRLAQYSDRWAVVPEAG